MIKKYKKGAASFYIVAFSTLILIIVAISFASVIISEVERTSNDDLSQSAYDSALAGIEDAKLAYYNYVNCKNNNSAGNCSSVVETMEKDYGANIEEECRMVWTMLGRNENEGGNVVESNTSGNNMSQATTCVTMTDEVKGYMGSLSPSKMVDVIRPKFGEGNNTISADDISKIRLSWYSRDDVSRNGTKFIGGSGKFPAASIPPIAPPVLSLAVLQTGPDFTMDSFNSVVGKEKTNRGMVYLIPSAESGVNTIEKGMLVKSNDKTVSNSPVAVKCDTNGEYVCSVEIELPKPIGDVRNSDTFEVVVSMPYGQPSADFRLEFFCDDKKPCARETVKNEDGTEEQKPTSATLKGVQIEVDSTGRANDLYRRVVTYLKNKEDLSLGIMGPLELLGNDKNDGLKKAMTITKEYNFRDQ